ncbi:MAG: hypothetical protein ABGF52_13470 [Candidatus Asgardarchaeum sp.]
MPFRFIFREKKKKVTLIGLPGSGKSAFLISFLYDTSKNPDKYSLRDFAESSIAKGYFFKLNEMIEKIRNGVPPSKTIPSEINELGLRLQVNKKECALFLRDFSGEYLTIFGSIDFNLNETLKNPMIKKFLDEIKHYDIFLIFYDPTKEKGALLMQSRGLNRIMIILRDIYKLTSISPAVIIPKCDLFPEIFKDPDGWLMEKDSFLYPYLKKNFKNFRVFAISAYGEAKQFDKEHWVPKEKDFTPKGIAEVFQWIRKVIY